MNFSKILVATDLSPNSTHALEHAAALAARHDAELHILHVHELQADWYGWSEAKPQLANIDDIIESSARKNLQKLAAEQTREVVHAVVRDLRAAPAIVHYAEVRDIDLVVTGTHARKGAGAMLGSVAAEVVRTSKVPTLVVGQQHAAPEQGYRNILVALDLTHDSAPLLRAAADFANDNGARLQLVHVVETHNLPTYDLGDYFEDQKAHAKRALDKLVDEAGLPDDTRSRVLEGTTQERVTTLARESEADLIITGQARLSALGRLMLGSSTRRILRRAPCPVLAWKTHGDSAASEA